MLSVFTKRYFTVVEEVFLALFFILCFGAVLFELTIARTYIESQKHLTEFIIRMVFLGHVHVFFTPIMLLSTRSGLAWIKEEENKNFIWKSLALLIGLTLFSYICLSLKNKYITMFYLVFISGAAFYHNMLQSMGFSFIYRRQEPDLKQWNTSLDKKIFITLTILVVIYFATLSVNYKLASQMRPTLFILSLSLSLIYILRPVFKQKRFSWSLFYDLRILLYPIAFYYYWGYIFVIASHGLEYAFLTKKYMVNEKKESGLLQDILFIGVVLMIIIASWRLLSLQLTAKAVEGYLKNPQITPLLISINTTITLYHYWLDGLIYRSDRNANRKWILPKIQ